MKIAAISDTHSQRFVVPECDVFIHAGDMSNRGSPAEVGQSLYTLQSAPQSFAIAGNHDFSFYDNFGYRYGRTDLLLDRAYEYQGKVFYGSPWTPPFLDWAYMKTEAQLAEVYKNMPAEIDVLITHGPAYGLCDNGLGSKALAYAIASRKIGLHLFGHIHEAGGESYGIHHNISALDLRYKMVRGAKEFVI